MLLPRAASSASFEAPTSSRGIIVQSPLSTARPPTSRRLPLSASAAALFPTAAHSLSVLGAVSSMPFAVTVVPTAP
ncbi:MAG: hypothetical protein DMF96_11905 [Acidobacteria bacterium]|nr:MAG: hypothetical protein DMF96_11905 [Acidobacteriota bacterium]